MKRFIYFLSLFLCICLSNADNLDKFNSHATNILPPHQAFSVNAIESSPNLLIHFNIAKGFYIYKERLKISSDTPGLVIESQINLPHGFMINVFNGESYAEEAVLNGKFDLFIPLPEPHAMFNLSVHLQGCDGKTICYPPQAYSFELGKPTGAVAKMKDSFTQIYSGVSGQANNFTNPFELFLVFFLAGIAISLTPCMYPLYPIALSAISQTSTKKSNIIKRALCYIHGISLIYVAMGIAAAFSGKLLITIIQTPVFVLIGSAILLLLGLAMFDLLEVRLPNRLHNYIYNKSASISGGGYVSAFILGVFSSLLLGPCVTPPLIIAIGFVASSGSILNGVLGLYAISLGMGVPILILATAGNKLLPKSGAWMNGVKHTLALVTIAVAIYLAYPFINLGNGLLSVGVLCFITALVFLLIRHFRSPDFEFFIHKIMPILMIIIGLIFTVVSSTQPSTEASVATTAQIPVTKSDMDELKQEIASSQKPVLVIISAKWCTICRELEATTFKDNKVKEEFLHYTVIHLDITDNQAKYDQFLNQYQLYGPPAILIFDKSKQLQHKITGYINVADFLKILNQS